MSVVACGVLFASSELPLLRVLRTRAVYMSLALRRAARSLQSPLGRAQRCAGSGPPGGFFGEGTQTGSSGLLFGETPPPPGHSRKWESWELPWRASVRSAMLAGCSRAPSRYLTGIATVVILGVGLNAKPDTSIIRWAREEAKKQMAEEEQSRA